MSGTVLGHLALHYLPGDERPARRLLELLGCTLVDNGPAPGQDGFCTVLPDGDAPDYAENLLFLSAVTPEQAAVEEAVRAAVVGTELRESMRTRPESSSHIGLRYRDRTRLDRVLTDLRAAAAPGGELEGRVEVVAYEPPDSFAPDWTQCFVTTDLCGFGILAFGSVFELDFVHDGFDAHEPPVFGRRRDQARNPPAKGTAPT